MKAILTGGGTGGHIYPALAVGIKLVKEGWDVLYIGSENGLEKRIVPGKGLKMKSVEVAPLPRSISPALIKSVFKSGKGFIQAGAIIKEFAPDVVLGTGGFVAGPVVLAASLRSYPTVIHEQNVYPGITNRLLAYSVDKIALNFTAARRHFPSRVNNKFVTTGNPVREVILTAKRNEGIKKLNLSKNKKTLLVTGGSQGAESINKAMNTVCKFYKNSNELQIIYITGERNYDNVIKNIATDNATNIKLIPYLHNMEWAYAAADLVVYRAGATGLAEITARGIPAILIPYPHATGNHQEYNARNLEEKGAAEVILDKKLNGEILIKKIERLIHDESRLAVMKKNSKKMGKPEARDNLITVMKSLV